MYRDKGFSLIELLITLSLLAMVLGVGYSLFSYGYQSFNRGEQRWIAQNNARLASKVLVRQLEGAYYYEISPTDAMVSGESQIYINNGNLVRLNFGDTNPTVIANGPLTASFSKTYNSTTHDEAHQIRNVISFSVTGTQGTASSTISSSAKAHNMIVDRGTTGSNETGTVLRLATTSAVQPVPTSGSSRCFIATAAYGSPSDRPVMVLRQFRDEFLLTNGPGRAFVDFYYRNSPSVANAIASSGGLRFMTRLSLAPVVGMAWLALYNPAAGLLICIGLFAVVGLMVFRRRRTLGGV